MIEGWELEHGTGDYANRIWDCYERVLRESGSVRHRQWQAFWRRFREVSWMERGRLAGKLVARLVGIHKCFFLGGYRWEEDVSQQLQDVIDYYALQERGYGAGRYEVEARKPQSGGAAPQDQAGFAKPDSGGIVPQDQAGFAKPGSKSIAPQDQGSPGTEEAVSRLRNLVEKAGSYIAILTETLDQGGLENVVRMLAVEYTARGIPVRVFCTKDGGTVAGNLTDRGIPVIELHGSSQALEDILCQDKPVLVNTHFVADFMELFEKYGIPVVDVIHNMYVFLTEEQLRKERSKARFVKEYIAVSEVAAQIFAGKILDGRKERVNVVGNAPDFLHDSPGKPMGMLREEDHGDIKTVSQFRPEDGKAKKTVSQFRPEDGKDKKTASQFQPEDGKNKKAVSQFRPEDGKDKKTASQFQPEDGKAKKTVSQFRPEDGKNKKTTSQFRPEDGKDEKIAAQLRTENRSDGMIEDSSASQGTNEDIGDSLLETRSRVRKALGIPQDSLVYLSAGSICARKNQIGLLRAWDVSLHLAKRPMVLVLAGSGSEPEYEKKVAWLIKERSLSGSVILTGHYQEIQNLMKAADFFLLDSYYEGWSMAATEGLLCGLPLIHSDCGSGRELVAGGRNGILVDHPMGNIASYDSITLYDRMHAGYNENIGQFAEAILRLQEEAEHWRGKRREIAEFARSNFSIEKMLEEYSEVFLKAMD